MTSKDDLTAPSAVARELREIEMLFERLSYHRHALLAAAAHLDGVPSETANARELNRHATFLRRYLVRNSESEVAQTPEERSFLEACNFLDGLAAKLWPAHERKPSHPEDFCERCHRPNVTWFAPSPLWNAAHGEWDILCPVCFVELAEAAGIHATSWKVAPEEHPPLKSSETNSVWSEVRDGMTLGQVGRLIDAELAKRRTEKAPARHPDGRRKGTSPLTAENLAARIAGEPPVKAKADDICSCGEPMGVHSVQAPWGPCLVRSGKPPAEHIHTFVDLSPDARCQFQDCGLTRRQLRGANEQR